MLECKNLINGIWKASGSRNWYTVLNPLNQQQTSSVPETLQSELDQVIQSAQSAFPFWRNFDQRLNLLVDLSKKLQQFQSEIAYLITLENGKTYKSAIDEISKGIDALNWSLSYSSHLQSQNTSEKHMPLGITAGIFPFNFPVMLALWHIPISLICGNCFIWKPSEKCPLASQLVAQLFSQFPPGVLQLVHGQKPIVEKLIETDEVKSIVFIGSSKVGQEVFLLSQQKSKKVQCNLGAKNHLILMPDADQTDALQQITGAAFGASGQRCMAISVIILVGEARNWINDIVQHAKLFKIGSGFDVDTDIPPLISKEAKERVCALIKSGVSQGAKLELDGCKASVDEYPLGNFIGPTIFSNVSIQYEIYKQEIFGPVVCILEAQCYQEALEIVNSNALSNGASIFTQSLSLARRFIEEVNAGVIGINEAVPLPIASFSFTVGNQSCLGYYRMNGPQAFEFYTSKKSAFGKVRLLF